MEAKKSMSAIIENVLYVQNQMQIFHFQTTSYAEHNAFGSFYDSFGDKADTLIEAIQGKYGRIFFKNEAEIEVYDYSDSQVKSCIQMAETFFTAEIWTILNKSKDEEIANLVQDILDAIQKLKYLLTLK